jgi:hypothetical protein
VTPYGRKTVAALGDSSRRAVSVLSTLESAFRAIGI